VRFKVRDEESEEDKVRKTEYVYLIRTCNKDRQGHNGFQWPESGPVSCPDWDPAPRCGGGLHGLLWGEGNHKLLNWDNDATWLVLKAKGKDVVYITEDGGGKWKFPKCEVVFSGKKSEAISFLNSKIPEDILARIHNGNTGIGKIATAGDRGILLVKWWDAKCERFRVRVGYVGEDGIKPDTKYILNGKHEFEEVK